MSAPAVTALVEQVRAARARRAALDIQGHGSKSFYGEACRPEGRGEALDVTGLTGIRSYEPTELVVTVGAGTPIVELEAALAEKGQCLPFEPPRFARAEAPGAGRGTVGGMVAAGLSGPSRAAVGGLRDYVLGGTLLSGRGELLTFGGQVMKNVAGYDVSRLLAGSMGVLGVICEVSLKVLPVAPATASLRLTMDEAAALRQLNRWAGQPLPLNASAWWDGTLVLRLSGAVAAVSAAGEALGGELVDAPLAADFWRGLRDQSDEFFVGAQRAVTAGASLWRLSLPSTAPVLKLSGEQLTEWGGALRWLCTTAPAAAVREAAAAVGGHATRFRSNDPGPGVMTALKAPLDRIHRDIKAAFDPDGLFNRGRLYPGL